MGNQMHKWGIWASEHGSRDWRQEKRRNYETVYVERRCLGEPCKAKCPSLRHFGVET